ncbi:hypothetical protein AB0J21_02860 [Streptomyces sp. NPDC049954]|uniref:hypothetical protein n=1 Tax=Streptomyces sp. NPDC049954 TaxID=3155779 RepID=UPI003423489D
MAAEQLPVSARESVHTSVGAAIEDFTRDWQGLLARIDQGSGWCGVFWERDPDGMRACLEGAETPPWDVVDAVLLDLAAQAAPDAVRAYAPRLRAGYAAALAARDALPGAAARLAERLTAMEEEHRYAARRARELERSLGAAPAQGSAEPLRRELAWARDDLARAAARCAELRARLERLASAAASGVEERARRPAPEAARAPRTPAPRAADPAPQRKKRPRGARFAGVDDALLEPAAPVPEAVAPVPAAVGARAPRGARFAGGAPDGPRSARRSAAFAEDPATTRAAHDLLARLSALRASDRGGEAHTLLVAAAHWMPQQLPYLAQLLTEAGLGADWGTLLWEAAALPVRQLVELAGALDAAGRAEDAGRLLRQGVVRPARETTEALLALDADGQRSEARGLASAFVRSRTPEDSARLAGAAPGLLVPLLLEAARSVSGSRHDDLVHALRVAGLGTA